MVEARVVASEAQAVVAGLQKEDQTRKMKISKAS
jgi:hypothetical protein